MGSLLRQHHPQTADRVGSEVQERRHQPVRHHGAPERAGHSSGVHLGQPGAAARRVEDGVEEGLPAAGGEGKKGPSLRHGGAELKPLNHPNQGRK